MKKIIIGASFLLFIALTALALHSHDNPLKAFINERPIQEVVTQLENSPIGGEIRATAFPGHIELSNDSKNLTIETDEFYVSMAPFIHETHPCTFHVFPGCMAELVSETMQVKIIDASGYVHFDGLNQTYVNGFMGFWLPKDQQYTVELSFGSYSGTFQFSTFENDPTCLTEFQLKNN